MVAAFLIANPRNCRPPGGKSAPAGCLRTQGEYRHDSAHSPLVVALELAPHVALGDLASPIAAVLAARQRQLDLRVRALEVDPGRNQGQAALLRLADQALDLLPVQEQLAGALRVVVLLAGRLV